MYPADARHGPVAPAGAVASEIIDTNGRTIAFLWVVGEHAGDAMLEGTWAWFDQFGITDGASSRPRLLP